MSGSLFFVAIVIVIGLILTVVITPIFLIPAVVIVLVTLFAAPLLGLSGRSEKPGGAAGEATGGVPSTEDASYTPVSEPTERGA